MQLFYNATIDESTRIIDFPKDESRHIVKVLRKSKGDILQITNGKGWLFSAEITSADIKQCEAKIVSKEQIANRDYHVHLAVAPTKMNDRYEWFLEKATEIGVDEITPIICKNSERSTIKKDRYEKILQSAMKQSLSCYLPQLNDAIALKDFLEQKFEGQKFIAHCEETSRKSFKKELEAQRNVLVLIGPEGDFTTEEIQLAIDKNFVPVTLGSSRLRTETAGVVACHTISLTNE